MKYCAQLNIHFIIMYLYMSIFEYDYTLIILSTSLLFFIKINAL